MCIDVPDQVRTLSQVGTSSYMAYATEELTQGVSMWLKKFLLGPIVKLTLFQPGFFPRHRPECQPIDFKLSDF